jgi:hypothetical protein
MFILGHNANLTLIQSPAVPADPTKGIAGSAVATRWTGIAPCYIDEDIVDVVKGNQLVSISQTLCSLPSNIPTWPNQEDLVTIVRISAVVPYSNAQPHTEVMKVRSIDGGNVMMGKLMLRLVRS